MIYGIGIDVVEIGRIEKAADRWGDRFLHRIYCPEELVHCMARVHPWAGLAARFAAKEAFVKALGTGFTRGISPSEICVLTDDDGRPGLILSGKAAQAMEEMALGQAHLSLSHEREVAVAMVVLEKGE